MPYSSQKNELELKKKLAQQAFSNRNYPECVNLFTEILSIDYTDFDTWNLAGLTMIELKDFARAVEFLSEGLHLAHSRTRELDSELQKNPLDSQIALSFKIAINSCEALYLNLAEAYRRAQKPLEAIGILHEALNDMPHLEQNATLHFNLAKAYVDANDPLSSVEHYRKALRLNPNDLGAMFNLANAQVTLEHFPEAIELYEMAYSRGFVKAGINLANTYNKLGFFSKALEIFQNLESIFSDDAAFIFNYANTLNYLNAPFEQTQGAYLKALQLDSENTSFYINYAHFLLKNHKFDEAFRIYEARKKMENMLPVNLPNLWNGSNADIGAFEGKNVLVHYEQGYGDTIMFGRFLPEICRIAKSVIFCVQKPLVAMFADALENFENLKIVDDNFSESSSNEPLNSEILNNIDSCISLLSLPLALGLGEKHIKQNQHYLKYQSVVKRALALGNFENLDSQKELKIGVCFWTDSKFLEASLKNIEPKILLKSLRATFPDSEKVKIYSLNFSGIDFDLCQEFSVSDCQKDMRDFLHTRKLLEQMDFVISIDTALAHLSASIGKSTFVLLNKRFDWRYERGVQNIWYENVLGFSQSSMGCWEDVLQNLCAFLSSSYGDLR